MEWLRAGVGTGPGPSPGKSSVPGTVPKSLVPESLVPQIWVPVQVIDPGFFNFESLSRSQIPDFLILRPGLDPSPQSRIFQISVPVPKIWEDFFSLSRMPTSDYAYQRNIFDQKLKLTNLLKMALIFLFSNFHPWFSCVS